MKFEYATSNTQRIEEIAEICNKMAADGWELDQVAVGGMGMGGGTRWLMVFKRPNLTK